MYQRLLTAAHGGEDPLLCSVGEDPLDLGIPPDYHSQRPLTIGGGSHPRARQYDDFFDQGASKADQVVQHSQDNLPDWGHDGDVAAPQPQQQQR